MQAANAIVASLKLYMYTYMHVPNKECIHQRSKDANASLYTTICRYNQLTVQALGGNRADDKLRGGSNCDKSLLD